MGKCCFGILELPYVLVPCSPSVGRGQGGIFWHQGHWRPLYCPLQAGVAGLRGLRASAEAGTDGQAGACTAALRQVLSC